MAQHNDTGKQGEAIALAHIKKLGFVILATNVPIGKAEIDIIALDGDILVFVEVKTRGIAHNENPAEAVGTKKRKMLIDAADEYVALTERENEVRFDIVSVYMRAQGHSLEYIPDAFNGMMY